MSDRLLIDALGKLLCTADRLDSNAEAANVVDGLYAIADAIQGHAVHAGSDATTVAASLESLARAVGELAHKVDDLVEHLEARGPEPPA